MEAGKIPYEYTSLLVVMKVAQSFCQYSCHLNKWLSDRTSYSPLNWPWKTITKWLINCPNPSSGSKDKVKSILMSAYVYTMGVYFFLKNPYLSKSCFMRCFKIFKLPKHFSPKLGYFQKNKEKCARNEEKIQKLKIMNKK